MEKVVLNATKRSVTGRKVNALRREGKLPAVMYGTKFESTPILLDLQETTLSLRGVTSSTIVTINLDGEEYNALLQDKQRDFIMGTYLHIDFRVLDMTQKITANVMLQFVGEAPAIEAYNGMLNTDTTELEVEALPRDLPEHIEVDISGLMTPDDSIYVKDIVAPSGVEILSDPEALIVSVNVVQLEAEEEEEEELEAGDVEPEVIEKGKREEEDEE
ncbi:MAG: 50S ribosomal protein L25 [Anaerolineaceae bacterium]|nr:50S ribosomal protein L25 [Anaerolineaceae bacterium]